MKYTATSLKLLMAMTLAAGASALQAQDVMWACNDPAGGIQIWFDYNENCPASPGSLAGLAEIGFHSGANGWASVVDWDAATAVTGVNMGNDTFLVRLQDPDTYYGVTVTAYNFVFNQGPENANEPWGSEGKEDDGNGGCADFYIDAGAITETCATSMSIRDQWLYKQLTVSPNPFTHSATISIDNPRQESYAIRVTNLAGQEVMRVNEFTGQDFLLERGNLPAGMYSVSFTNAEGKFATTRVEIR